MSTPTPPAPAPDLAGWVQQQAKQVIDQTVLQVKDQIASQAVDAATVVAKDAKDTAVTLHDQSIAAIKVVAASVGPAAAEAVISVIPQVKKEVMADVMAISGNVQHDAVTQRHIALAIVILLGEAAIAMLICYCIPATSPQVKGIIGWASVPAIGSALVGWAVTGFKTPFTGKDTPVVRM